MNEPNKLFERFMMKGELKHGGNPILRWMASNATAKTDASGNIKPDKSKSTEKIDGVVASIMAVGLTLADTPESDTIVTSPMREF